MTMPHLQNCPHSPDSWCLDCVKDLGQELLDKDELVRDLTAALAFSCYIFTRLEHGDSIPVGPAKHKAERMLSRARDVMGGYEYKM